LRNARTRLIVRALSSGGSRHGKTVISALGASDATSIEVGSGCDGVSSGKTRIGVRQLLMKSRGTLMLANTTYNVERELEREIESEDPV
jgi:hypothetical protein